MCLVSYEKIFRLIITDEALIVNTGIATSSLAVIDSSLADILSGTIVAAAIINEIIAVIIAKMAFKWSHEIEDCN